MEWWWHRRFIDASVGHGQGKGGNHDYKASLTKCQKNMINHLVFSF